MPIAPPKPRLPRRVNVSSRTTTQYASSRGESASMGTFRVWRSILEACTSSSDDRGHGMAFQNIQELAATLRAFAAEREWDQFHSPRNLAAALSVEASEVLEHFQWKTDEQSRSLSKEQKEQVAMELADVFIYLVRLADRLDVDLLQAARQKMQVNAQKYPVEITRGTIRKIP